ncbi:FG-GAP-like repeat-containing protein, partial [Akkermansiaceae bacterium]|nr:FG-GAP-like repeat-containing protein [Akkermansiaceae bacterium]
MVYQRPTQVAVGGESTGINFSSIGARTAADLELENLDPGKAGWDTELQSDAAARALTLIFDKDGGDKPINEDFRGTPLRPDLVEIYSSDGIQVRRLQGRQPGDEVRTLDKIGFLKALPKQHGTRKIIRIAQEGDEGDFSTRVIASTHDESLVGQWHQTTSVWDCNWAFSALEPDELPLLKRLTLLSHEEVIRTGKKPLFEDVAGNVLPEKIGPHDSPVTDWARTLTKIDDMHFAGHHGIAIGDANGDGLDDLYVCDCGGLPNRLYLQNPEGTTRDISAQAGVDWLESSKSALFLDLDNDGDQDLVVATVALVLVLENNGQASFSLRSRIPGMSNPHSLSAADYDSDGDLDLFVCNYGADSVTGGLSGSIAGPPLPFNDAENGDVFLDSQFDNGGDGQLYEYELIYYPTSEDGNGFKRPQPDSVTGSSVSNASDDPELYRWFFLNKNNREADNFAPIMAYNQHFRNSGASFDAGLEDVVDIDSWFRGMAYAVLSGAGDNAGSGSQHNGMYYARPDGRIMFLPHDMDFGAAGGNPTASIFANRECSKLANSNSTPGNAQRRRIYFGILHDIVTTTWNSAYMSDFTTHLAS